MENMKGRVLVYDDNCPLCAAYSKQFIRWGLLPKNGRIGYGQAPQEIICHIDQTRYRTEIALVDTTSGESLYGIDGMMYIMASRFPQMNILFNQSWFRYIFRKLYAFISYNRKVISPFGSKPVERKSIPPFHLGYRLAFIAFAILLASYITILFGRSLFPLLIPGKASPGIQMLLMAGTGWVIQLLASLFSMKGSLEARITYAGHLGVIMIIGVGLLIPSIVLTNLISINPLLLAIPSILLSFSIMLWQHYKRIHCMAKSQRWTVLWLTNLMLSFSGWAFYFNS